MNRSILRRGWATVLPALFLVGCPDHQEHPRKSLLSQGIAHGFPAMVLLVDRPGEELWVEAAGYASLEQGIAMTPSHAVHLASITKQFTSVATLRLVDEGRISLHDRLIEILDDDSVHSLPHSDEITVAQLLDHSSGIYGTNNDREYLEALVGPHAGDNVDWTARDFVALAARREPFGEPGEGHFYGDTNYVLLGMIVEEIAGEPLHDHVRTTIFEPLGLSSAYYLSQLPGGAAPPVPTAQGYLRFSDRLLSFLKISGTFPKVDDDLLNTTSAGERIDGAAAVVATAEDLWRFADAVLRKDFSSPESRSGLLAVADGLEREPVGAERQRILTAYHKPYGVIVTAEGDGPGGSNTVLAYHPQSDTILIALINIFGLFDESDFVLDDLLPQILDPTS